MFQKILAYISLGLFLLSNLFLNGCKNTAISEELTGKWEHNGHVYEYTDSGKLYYDDIELDYEIIDNNVFRLINRKTNYATMFSYRFNDNGTVTINGVNYYPAD